MDSPQSCAPTAASQGSVEKVMVHFTGPAGHATAMSRGWRHLLKPHRGWLRQGSPPSGSSDISPPQCVGETFPLLHLHLLHVALLAPFIRLLWVATLQNFFESCVIIQQNHLLSPSPSSSSSSSSFSYPSLVRLVHRLCPLLQTGYIILHHRHALLPLLLRCPLPSLVLPHWSTP